MAAETHRPPFSSPLALTPAPRWLPAVYSIQAFAFIQGVASKTLTVEAIYENGVFKPVQPLPFREQEKVRLTIEREQTLVDRTYGLIGWQGDYETLERLLAEAEEPEELP